MAKGSFCTFPVKTLFHQSAIMLFSFSQSSHIKVAPSFRVLKAFETSITYISDIWVLTHFYMISEQCAVFFCQQKAWVTVLSCCLSGLQCHCLQYSTFKSHWCVGQVCLHACSCLIYVILLSLGYLPHIHRVICFSLHTLRFRQSSRKWSHFYLMWTHIIINRYYELDVLMVEDKKNLLSLLFVNITHSDWVEPFIFSFNI